jgi:hypothetical protein
LFYFPNDAKKKKALFLLAFCLILNSFNRSRKNKLLIPFGQVNF